MTLLNTTLGPLTLSPHLVLRQEVETHSRTWEDKRTIGGRFVARPAMGRKGRKLVLDGDGNHFTVAQCRAIRQLIDAGQPVLLQHHTWIGTVRVDAISGYSLPLDYADFADDDWVSASIDLTEI